MRTFILWIFGMYLFVFVVDFLQLIFIDTWPREKETTLGQHIASMMLIVGFALWAAYTLWG